jgi:glycosyltransferase involved in cell wall biosynthesis
MSIRISIVICTYNRSELLKGCLQSLYEQSCDSAQHEVIVIDNNSTDDTRKVFESYIGYPNFHYCFEQQQGLSHARNRGLSEAQGQYIAYLDDDVLVPPTWIAKALELIQTEQPPLDGFGGPLHPFYTSPKPEWFEDRYAIQMGGKNKTYFLHPGHSFIGANMAWDRELLRSIGGFRVDLGYIEYLGEETDAFTRAWHLKPAARFLHSPDLSLRHWLPPQKMLLSYRIKRNIVSGLFLFQISGPKSFKARFLYSLNKLFGLLKGMIKALLVFKKYPLWQKWVYCEWSPRMVYFGELCGSLGIKPTKNLFRKS